MPSRDTTRALTWPAELGDFAMNASVQTTVHATTVQTTLLDDDTEVTLLQLCRAVRIDERVLLTWVDEGVLQPLGGSGASLRFRGESLKRARVASRLSRDLELDAHGLALALDLLDEIDALRARLARAGI
jgi:chaperone modulatory protein CbpM